ncbi:MAG: glycosyl hydrolase, partial [Armatimonadota bacterium]|nr:glycosyl hydrolase [Armatimonadota bacterium]
MNAGRFFTLAGVLLLVGAPGLAAPVDLAAGFTRPPDSAKPHTWWHWMNGNATREGITADLEAMRRVGVGGAQIFNVDCGITPGPVKIMSPEWRALMQHAFAEAARLGLEICVHNCPGWSSSGGPWNKPEHAMQVVVTTETRVQGPSRFDGVLPQPTTRLGYYRDIAVLAFRTPPAEAMRMADLGPKWSASFSGFDGTRLMDGKGGTRVGVPVPGPGEAHWVLLEFPRPVTGRSLLLVADTGRDRPRVEVEASDDGTRFRRIAAF